MEHYIVTARATFEDTKFFVEADSEEQAIKKVNDGKYSGRLINGGAERIESPRATLSLYSRRLRDERN